MYISNNLLHLQTLSAEISNPGSSKAGDYSKCMKILCALVIKLTKNIEFRQ